MNLLNIIYTALEQKIFATTDLINGCYVINPPSNPAYPIAVIRNIQQNKIQTIGRIFHSYHLTIDIQDNVLEDGRCDKDVHQISSDVFDALKQWRTNTSGYSILFTCYDLKAHAERAMTTSVITCQVIIEES